MRDDGGRRVSTGLRAARLAALLLAAWAASGGSARAQSVRGYTQLQFQRFDLVDADADRDLWLRTLQLDVTRRIAQRYDLTGQIYWNEVSTEGRPDRIRSPRGTLRLAHPVFGAWFSWRPIRTTDALGVTTHADEMQASGYFARPRFPALNATWTRRTLKTGDAATSPPTVSRNLTAAQSLGRLTLHAGYFDQVREVAGSRPADERRNALAGGEVRFGPPRASFFALYNVNETKRVVGGALTERTLFHNASLNGTSRV